MREIRARRAAAFLSSVAAVLLAAAPADASACANANLEPTTRNEAKVVKALVCLINSKRTAHGLGALKVNGKLARAARKHSVDMVDHHYFAHQSRNGDTLVERARHEGYMRRASSWWLGENIAWGGGRFASAKGVLETWLASPPHRANLYSRKSKESGIGIARGVPTGGGSGATFTLMVGKRA